MARCAVSGDFLLAGAGAVLLSIGDVGSASGAVFGSVLFFELCVASGAKWISIKKT